MKNLLAVQLIFIQTTTNFSAQKLVPRTLLMYQFEITVSEFNTCLCRFEGESSGQTASCPHAMFSPIYNVL